MRSVLKFSVTIFLQEVFQAIVAVHIFFTDDRFRNSVSVQYNNISGIKLVFHLNEGPNIHDSEHNSTRVHLLDVAVFANNIRGIVSRIASRNSFAVGRNFTEEHGDETIRRSSRKHFPIEQRNNFVRFFAGRCNRPESCLQVGHQQRGSEKGHVVIGPEADGRTTADDLGMGKLVSAAKWCIGKPLLARPALIAPDRWQLVGLTAQDGATMPRAAKIVADPDHALPNPMLGHVTSWCWSPNLDAWIALALVANGRERHGETLWAVSPLANAKVRVKVGPPCYIDPEGGRLRV